MFAYIGGFMRVSHTIFGCVLAVSLAGCSIRPLPKNVTRDTTIKIINKIRCETRNALVERISSVLKKPREGHHKVSAENLEVLRKLEYYGTSEKVMREIRLADVDTETEKLLRRFALSSIVYNFRFKITENKVKGGGGTFTMPFIGGSFTLGLSAGSDKSRANERIVELGDTFRSLLTGLDLQNELTGLDCDDVDQPRKHWIYPITGNIGMAEVINTFVDLEKASGTVSTFNDILTFTTILDVSALPSVALNTPDLKHFKLTSANATYTAKRTDIHEVTVTLVKGEPDPEVDVGYTKITDLSRIEGFPKKSEVGFRIKKSPSKKDPAKIKKDIKQFGISGQPAVSPSGRLFSFPPNALEKSLRRAFEENERLKGVSRQ